MKIKKHQMFNLNIYPRQNNRLDHKQDWSGYSLGPVFLQMGQENDWVGY